MSGAKNVRGDVSARHGIALVVTLVMLSVITFLAIAFLVLSRREHGSVATTTDQNTARFTAESALDRAKSEIVASIMATRNPQAFGFMVSTNYINPFGFQNGISDPTNVNYTYSNGAPLNVNDLRANLTNLLYDPRPPVVTTNGFLGSNEFRYYMDLNRNRKYDTNGLLPVMTSDPNLPYINATNGVWVDPNVYNGPILSNRFIGDPEWIGVLEYPNRPHSADNRFLARYLYYILPIGKTLDLNYIHNQALNTPLSATDDGFVRNQGNGPWEINLAAFLTDLNTNQWDTSTPAIASYNYQRGANLNLPNTGYAFDDAFSIINYRYAKQYNSLLPASQVFSNASVLTTNNIDEYVDGPLMLNSTNVYEIGDAHQDNPANSWVGSDNTNHYFTTQELFDPKKTSANFTNRLQSAGVQTNSYDRYTFYRLLSQLGTESSPEIGKMNLNYRNMSNGVVVPGLETNLLTWTPLDFFTNAANAMFKDLNLRENGGRLVTVTNIPLYPTNYYTPAVHRVLQLAANMFDSTATRFIGDGPTNYPSVFRPYFRSEDGIVSIAGFLEESNSTAVTLPFLELTNMSTVSQVSNGVANVYGVPWVIGAKKGFPTFNEFAMENSLTVTRKLEFTNYNNSTWRGITNQMFLFSLTNAFGVEAWNSYTNAYQRPLRLVVTNEVSVIVSNEFGISFLNASNLVFGADTAPTNYSSWPGWNLGSSGPSFKVPLSLIFALTNGVYLSAPPWFKPATPAIWSAAAVPHLWMSLSYRLRYYVIDTSTGRIVDFVNITGAEPPLNLIDKLSEGYDPYNPSTDASLGGQWNYATNTSPGHIPWGVLNQIGANLGNPVMTDWKDQYKNDQIACFKYHLKKQGTASLGCTPSTFFQAPYSSTRTIYQHITLEVNDPLVHYIASDLASTNGYLKNLNTVDFLPQGNGNLGSLNYAFQPWGGYKVSSGPGNPNPQFDYNMQVKDPLVAKSDDWSFWTNTFANIGWLGRVHRGTPWQTVYLKSSAITNNQWSVWASDTGTWPGNTNLLDASLSHPTVDRNLFDLFTTVPHPNAASGLLSVNVASDQTNDLTAGIAAWSAVLSGVITLTNTATAAGIQPVIIPPAGAFDINQPVNQWPPLARIVVGINETRTNTALFPNRTFDHVGDVLATPELTERSPFIGNTNNMPDAVFERIPQQIMSLLTLTDEPRFVIYCYGQTLRPADRAVIAGGPFNGLCTNYQITAEQALRAVVRAVPKRVSNGVTNYDLVTEQFNVLPPD